VNKGVATGEVGWEARESNGAKMNILNANKYYVLSTNFNY
jgi:hypothetical protein